MTLPPVAAGVMADGVPVDAVPADATVAPNAMSQEDVVMVTKTGCKILSRFPKQLEI